MSNIEGVAGSFAPQKPLEGAGAKRAISSLTDIELKFTRPFVRGVTLEAVFKRAK